MAVDSDLSKTVGILKQEFIFMKTTGDQSITASSGEVCPCSGEWEIIGVVSTTAVFAKDQIIPEYYGKQVVWVLIRRE